MNGVVAFLDGWKSLASERGAAPTRDHGIRALLAEVARRTPLKGAEGPRPKRRASAEAVRRLFEGLQAPLSAARATGSLIDIWSVAGLRRRELPNASVFSWLIDPRGSHGQGALCLSALLEAADPDGQAGVRDLNPASARVQAEMRPLGSDRDRVDIVVDLRELLVFIEVKIDAGEGQAQLARYAESASRVAAARAVLSGETPAPTLTIFLSPRPPAEAAPGLIHLTWRDLASALDRAAGRSEGLAQVLIRSFSAHVRAFG